MVIERTLMSGVFLTEYRTFSEEMVIFVPGVAWSKVGPYFLFSKIAKILYSNNISSCLFDYYGQGDSWGDYKDLTFDAFSSSLNQVIDELMLCGYKNVILVGNGIGNIVCNSTCVRVEVKALYLIDYNPDFLEKIDIENFSVLKNNIFLVKLQMTIRVSYFGSLLDWHHGIVLIQ